MERDALYEALAILCDAIIEIEMEEEKKSPAWLPECRRITEEMWTQIENRIDKYGDDEKQIAMTFLMTNLKRLIVKCFEEDEYAGVIKKIFKHFCKELKVGFDE